MRSTRPSRWRTAAFAACAAGLSACDSAPVHWVSELRMRILGGASAPAAEAAPAPPEAPAAPPPRPPTEDTLRLELTGERRFAGGRPLPWWSERLGRLRKDGPEELYRLTLARAGAAGLAVTERPDGGFEVAAAARAEARR